MTGRPPMPQTIGAPPHILFDIVHPADVLFFLHPIRWLMETGHPITIASRDKDITTTLLDELGLAHTPLTTAGRGRLGLATELIRRDLRLTRLAHRTRPDLLVGFGGVAISHVGRLLGIPSLAFYDSEFATLQTRLTLPFIDAWHVPDCFTGPCPAGRTIRFKGTKELSYLHPDQFQPDRDRARAAGWREGRVNVLVRTVAWEAAHDLGRKGLGEEGLAAILGALPRDAVVHLSQETPGPMPPSVHPYQGAPLDIHHLMAFCDLHLGDSPTMAAESAVLGVPAFYLADRSAGYLSELTRAGLLFTQTSPRNLAPLVQDCLNKPKEEWRQKQAALLARAENVALHILDAIRAWTAT